MKVSAAVINQQGQEIKNIIKAASADQHQGCRETSFLETLVKISSVRYEENQNLQFFFSGFLIHSLNLVDVSFGIKLLSLWNLTFGKNRTPKYFKKQKL